ncbi:hypothetical protein ABB37_07659 [Leptomonas pyrrhocoris]|uniref:Uncharacterized protein n=1 Tax=Leptomonas pyrrhocoris TaxID=157538 RepID=A0A0N0DT29_LEPPY|nr:hypothetical protein ABB37_07659 [Leptomonas pyrrhocoris]KPA76864.1 hypothetical protein ABB37_07659 [Leptomonas pyrrhocoris]|eukprot:XP_015655303.1 hypothetical protein ABB37_07659 [Leptomonas pyrrhocoris]
MRLSFFANQAKTMQRKAFVVHSRRSGVQVSHLRDSSEMCVQREDANRSCRALLSLLLSSAVSRSFTKTSPQCSNNYVTSSRTSESNSKLNTTEVIAGCYGFFCSSHRGMLRCWRLQPRPLLSLHTRCAASDAGQEGRDAFECRQRWYQRQLHTQTLFPVDLIPLAQRLPLDRSSSPLTQREGRFGGQTYRNADAMTDAFLSCCRSSLCDATVLQSIFRQLSPDQQCAILTQSLSHETHQRLPLISACVEEALRNSTLSPGHWILVLSSVKAGDPAPPLPVTAILKNVFLSRTSAFGSPDDARVFIAQALSLMERQKTPFTSIVDCLSACGLAYEACAYASSSSSFVSFPFAGSSSVEEQGGWGYGPLLHRMCALPKPPLKWFGAVRSKMPPAVQRYSTLVVLHAALRKRGDIRCVEDEVWRLFTAELLSPLEAASALHFVLHHGNTFTARLLLDHCHTAQQVLTLMRYTHGAEHPFTFQALEKSLTTRTTERVHTHLRLESRERRTKLALFFDAQLGNCEASRRPSERGEDPEGELCTQTLSIRSLDRGLLHQCLRDALPHSVLVRGERSLAQVLAAIPASAVEHVANSLPTVHGDVLSWWISLYLKGGNVDGALAVLTVVAARGCLPHMAVLVELLECTQDDTDNFVRSVTMLRQSFPQATDAVLRAFVERTATSMTRAAPPSTTTAQAVHALKSLAVMGLPRLSARCLSDIAAHDSADTISAVMALAQELGGSPGCTTEAAPLDVAAIRGLAMAGRQLNYRVCVSVAAFDADGVYAGWWGSASRPLRSLTRFAYLSADLSLWPWVEKEALADSSRLSCDELHKAVRIVALGSRDAKIAVAFWNAAKAKMQHEGEKRRVSREDCRASAKRDEYTLACVCAVCVTQGQKQLASHLIRDESSNTNASPLLAAFSTLHMAPTERQLAIRKSELQFEKFSKRSLTRKARGGLLGRGAQKASVRETPRSLLCYFPPSLQRLVRASGSVLVDSFSAPDEWEHLGRGKSPTT